MKIVEAGKNRHASLITTRGAWRLTGSVGKHVFVRVYMSLLERECLDVAREITVVPFIDTFHIFARVVRHFWSIL